MVERRCDMKNDNLVIKPKKAKGEVEMTFSLSGGLLAGKTDTKSSQSESGKKLWRRLMIFLPEQDIVGMN